MSFGRWSSSARRARIVHELQAGKRVVLVVSDVRERPAGNPGMRRWRSDDGGVAYGVIAVSGLVVRGRRSGRVAARLDAFIFRLTASNVLEAVLPSGSVVLVSVSDCVVAEGGGVVQRIGAGCLASNAVIHVSSCALRWHGDRRHLTERVVGSRGRVIRSGRAGDVAAWVYFSDPMVFGVVRVRRT